MVLGAAELAEAVEARGQQHEASGSGTPKVGLLAWVRAGQAATHTGAWSADRVACMCVDAGVEHEHRHEQAPHTHKRPPTPSRPSALAHWQR